ncbi:MAG: hypothetical protein JO142_11865 [Burkholderiales bacterium]|nr:hypothetical protein [Burkholderiales bacterium]
MKSRTKRNTQAAASGLSLLLKVSILLTALALGCVWALIAFVGLSVAASFALAGGVLLCLVAGFTTRVVQTRRRLARAMALEHEVLRHAEAAFNQLRAEEAARAARQTSG